MAKENNHKIASKPNTHIGDAIMDRIDIKTWKINALTAILRQTQFRYVSYKIIFKFKKKKKINFKLKF